jgi:hypothetical protein
MTRWRDDKPRGCRGAVYAILFVAGFALAAACLVVLVTGR